MGWGVGNTRVDFGSPRFYFHSAVNSLCDPEQSHSEFLLFGPQLYRFYNEFIWTKDDQ